MTLDRNIPFRTGRKDCVPDPDLKWTPYAFEATKAERHSNTFGTGTQVIKDLKRSSKTPIIIVGLPHKMMS